MGSPSYLLKKHDTYYFRQAWPNSLKPVIGQREIVRSLGVKEKSLAIRMAREFKINLDLIIDQISFNSLSDTKSAKQYLNNSLCGIKSKYISLKGSTCNIKTDLQIPERTQSFPCYSEVKNTDKENLDNIINKKNISPLFKKYATEKIRLKKWSEKSYKERFGHFNLILSLLRSIKNTKDIYIEDINLNDVRKLKEYFLLLPKNHNKKFPNMPIKELLTKCISFEKGDFSKLSPDEVESIREKISLNTISDKYVSTVKGFWQWLNEQEYISSDIFKILKYDYKKITNSWKTYTTEDLNNLFNDKIYQTNTPKIKYQYFVPIISLYTSCRLQEICQLKVDDVIRIGDIFAINVKSDEEKSLKTVNSERFVPIHNELISCGFLKYVEALKEKGEVYLFPELKNEDNATKSRRVSKWFNERYKIKKGIDREKSFHSFRRTFINEMSRNGASDSDIREMIGHKPEKSDTLNNHYKDEMSVQAKWKLIKNRYLKI